MNLELVIFYQQPVYKLYISKPSAGFFVLFHKLKAYNTSIQQGMLTEVR